MIVDEVERLPGLLNEVHRAIEESGRRDRLHSGTKVEAKPAAEAVQNRGAVQGQDGDSVSILENYGFIRTVLLAIHRTRQCATILPDEVRLMSTEAPALFGCVRVTGGAVTVRALTCNARGFIGTSSLAAIFD